MRPSRKRIASVISERLSRGESLNRLAKEVAAYLLSEGRYSELDSIIRDVKALRANDGDVEVSLASAHELPAIVIAEVKELVKSINTEAKKVTIDQTIDESLIGGFKLSVIDKSLDLSVRSKLNRLKQLAYEGGI